MIFMNLKRIARVGFVSFWRNWFVSLTSILVMTMTLFVIGSVIFIGAVLDSTVEQIKSKVDVNVYFVTSAGEEDVLSIKKSIEALPEVASVEYISREKALEDFRLRHADDQLTIQALEELEDNPLGAGLNIRAKETSQYESIAGFLENDGNVLSGAGAPIIDKVNYFQNKAAIDRLTSLTDSLDMIGLLVTIALSVISAFIVFNTIRLVIYTSREEISVMRLVGASNLYIRGPFIVEGVMSGLSAAVIALALFYPLTFWFGSFTQNFLGGVNLFDYYLDNFGQIFIIVILSGVFLGGLSSFLAVKRYLKV